MSQTKTVLTLYSVHCNSDFFHVGPGTQQWVCQHTDLCHLRPITAVTFMLVWEWAHNSGMPFLTL